MTDSEDDEPTAEYPSFNLRVMAATVDICIVMIFAIPFTNWALDKLLGPLSVVAFTNTISTDDLNSISKLIPELWKQFREQHMLERSLYLNIIQAVMLGLYTLPFWFKYAATPGKMLFRMEIHDATSGERITRFQAVVRYLCYTVSFLPMTIGFLWAAFNKKHRAWHDFLANTVVIIRPKKKKKAKAEL